MAKSQMYYIVGGSVTQNPAGLMLENANALKAPGMPAFGIIDPRKRGGRPFPEAPRFRYVKSKGRKPGDLEEIAGYWLITKEAKKIFQEIDADAFESVPCETIIDGRDVVGDYYLCDVVRVLDALDEGRSNVLVASDGSERYRIVGFEDLYFRPEIVGAAHIFRVHKAWHVVICDEVVRQACKRARLKNVRFRPALFGADKKLARFEAMQQSIKSN